MSRDGEMREKVNKFESEPVSYRALPAIAFTNSSSSPENRNNNPLSKASQILFYQYVEPEWSKAKMKSVLGFMRQVGGRVRGHRTRADIARRRELHVNGKRSSLRARVLQQIAKI